MWGGMLSSAFLCNNFTHRWIYVFLYILKMHQESSGIKTALDCGRNSALPVWFLVGLLMTWRREKIPCPFNRG